MSQFSEDEVGVFISEDGTPLFTSGASDPTRDPPMRNRRREACVEGLAALAVAQLNRGFKDHQTIGELYTLRGQLEELTLDLVPAVNELPGDRTTQKKMTLFAARKFWIGQLAFADRLLH
jgi:hypothetical protein